MFLNQNTGRKYLETLKWRLGGCCLIILLGMLLGCGAIACLTKRAFAQDRVPSSQQILLLIDNSQSMFDTNDPNLLRIEATRLFITYLGVDTNLTTQQLGIIFFGTEAETIVPLTVLNDDLKRTDLFELIAHPSDMGWTNPQAAFDLAEEMFAGAKARDTAQVAILLTDGKPEWRKNPSAGETEQVVARLRETAAGFAEKGIPLFTILLHDANTVTADPDIETIYAPLWQELAQMTPGGKFYRADRDEALVDIYHDIVISLTHRNSDGAVIKTTVQTETIEPVPVEANLAQVTFVIRKSDPALEVVIFQPDGNPLADGIPGVQYVGQAGVGTEEIWAISHPQTGMWQVRINGQGQVEVWKDFYPATPTPSPMPSPASTATGNPPATFTPLPTITPVPATATLAPTVTHTPFASPVSTPLPASGRGDTHPIVYLGLPVVLLGLVGGGWAYFAGSRRTPLLEGSLRRLNAPAGNGADVPLRIDLDALRKHQLLLGPSAKADICLPQTAVEVTMQAQVDADGLSRVAVVTKLGKTENEPAQINNLPITDRSILWDGDVIKLAPYTFRYESLRARVKR